MTQQAKDGPSLVAALKAAKPGDTILLAGGKYALPTLKNLKLGGVTIAPLGPAKPVFLPFIMSGVSGLTLASLEFDSTGLKSTYAWQFLGCSDIRVYGGFFHGDLNGDPQAQTEGLNFANCQDIMVSGCEFTKLYRGMAHSEIDRETITDNHFHDLARTAIFGANVRTSLVARNRIHDLHPKPGDHMDGITFNPSSGPNTTSEVTVQDNLMWRGAGEVFQGIQFRAPPASTTPFRNITIRRNITICVGQNGIYVDGVKGLTLDANTVWSAAKTPSDPGLSWIIVQDGDQIAATNNLSSLVSISPPANRNTNWSEVGSRDPGRLTPAQAARLVGTSTTASGAFVSNLPPN